MRALTVSSDAPFGLGLTDVVDPVPAADEVLVEVTHTSLNFGEVNAIRLGSADPGAVPGWDAAGIVAVPARNGSGPPAGSRVTTFGYSGAWAQRRAVSVDELAVVPESVELADAAALPVAGVTALRALRRSGALLGRRVLITGASGGVGRFAVRLAALAGAHVIAAARRAAGLAELGADEVVADLDQLDDVDVVLDNVGGAQLVRAWQLLVPGGVLQSIGWTSGEQAVFPPYGTVGPAKSLMSFQAGSAFGADLRLLLALVADGSLTVDIGWRGSWQRFDDATQALLTRQVTGKAVLAVD